MRKSILFLIVVLLLSLPTIAQQERHFTFHYGFTVRNVPPGQPLRVWFPQAQSDDFQEVKIVSIKGELPVKKTRETQYGDAIFYAAAPKATKPEYNFDVEYDVVRRERIGLPREGVQAKLVKTPSGEAREYLGPHKLVPVTGRLAAIAAQQVQGKNTTLEKARALYDYIFSTMRYDKTGTGWGRGDAEWACDSKRGNCTDFHSVFLSMVRSQHIPARFSIGFPLPADRTSGEIAGYHCWAEFYDAQYGWVPVDISEAWKDPKRKDYFFGAHDANRIQFSAGRDLALTPPQAGEPLNYFIYPYVEVAGKKYENVSNCFSFVEAGGTKTAAISKTKETP